MDFSYHARESTSLLQADVNISVFDSLYKSDANGRQTSLMFYNVPGAANPIFIVVPFILVGIVS